jgi:hypothetical protein
MGCVFKETRMSLVVWVGREVVAAGMRRAIMGLHYAAEWHSRRHAKRN